MIGFHVAFPFQKCYGFAHGMSAEGIFLCKLILGGQLLSWLYLAGKDFLFQLFHQGKIFGLAVFRHVSFLLICILQLVRTYGQVVVY